MHLPLDDSGNVLQAAKLCVYVENADELFNKAVSKGMQVEKSLENMLISINLKK